MAEKPSFRQGTVFAKNLGFGVGFGYRNNTSENMWRRYWCLTSSFPIVDTFLRCKDIARQSCAMVPIWRFLATFLRPVFSASHVQQVSDLHPCILHSH